MGRDDNASVATLVGYSYRKLGDYGLAQIWYERALKTAQTTSRRGNIMACGKSSRATASRRSIT